MKRRIQYKYLLFFFSVAGHAAPLLDGTASIIYRPSNVVFHAAGGAQSKVQGFTLLSGGFTILPDASAIFDTAFTVSGPIDLRDTGTLILNADLYLASNVTLSSGGTISGQNNTIFLGGSLSVPASKIFHIRTNTVIDGQGHTINMGDYAQLFIDNNVTLTLQNIVLRSGQKTNVFPPVRCAGPSSQLVLDNIILEPQGDIPFYQGKMYIYDNVIFTGTSAFVYTSPQSSFITSGASLLFDKTTTFSFAPSTTSNNQIIMNDATSKIILDGASLKVTATGMMLSAGMLLFDNKVLLDTLNGSSYMSTISTATAWVMSIESTFWGSVSWHPSGRFLATHGNSCIRLYSFNGTTFRSLSTLYYGYPYTLSWSPDGCFLAVALSNSSFTIYSFNGSILTLVASKVYGGFIRSISWSPDGQYIAIGGTSATNGGSSGFSNTNELRVYYFNGNTVTSLSTASQGMGTDIYITAWDPSGNYLAEGSATPPVNGGFGASSKNANGGSSNGVNRDCLRIYKFLSTTFTLTPVSSITYGGGVHGLAWSPDSSYITIAGFSASVGDPVQGHSYNMTNSSDLIRVYKFSYNATTPAYSLTPITSRGYGSWIYQGVGWSPDGKSIAYCGGGATSGGNTGFNDTNLLRIYIFDGTTLIPASSYAIQGTGGYNCKWHPMGNPLVVGVASQNGGSMYFNGVFPNYYPARLSQALSNSLVLGISFVTNAWYGSASEPAKRYDKTNYINDLIIQQNGALSVTANNATFGDPASGVAKTLSITFRNGATVTCLENSSITLTAAQVLSYTGSLSLKAKVLSAARVEIRGKVFDKTI